MKLELNETMTWAAEEECKTVIFNRLHNRIQRCIFSAKRKLNLVLGQVKQSSTRVYNNA